MEKKSEKPAADRLTAPNVAADSPSRRAFMVQSEASSMQNESAAASSLCRPITPEHAARFAGRARAATMPRPTPPFGTLVGLTGTLGSVAAVDDRDPAIPNPNNLAAALRQGPALKARGRNRQAQSRALMIGP